MENQKLLTVKEVALMLDIPESTVKTSTIPRIKIGRCCKFIESEVEQWILEQKRTVGKKPKRKQATAPNKAETGNKEQSLFDDTNNKKQEKAR